jgi:hypothetical protein
MAALMDRLPSDHGILVHILGYAASFENIPTIARTCKTWDNIVNSDLNTSTTIWKSICAAYDPELVRIFPLCRESQAFNVAGGGWKTILRRRKTSEFRPGGKFGKVVKSLETVFCHPINGIQGFYGYPREYPWNDDYYVAREQGLFFFHVNPFQPPLPQEFIVIHRNHDYLLSNWEQECGIIWRWFAVWGVIDKDAITIIKPEHEGSCTKVQCHVDLNSLDFDNLPHPPQNFSTAS